MSRLPTLPAPLSPERLGVRRRFAAAVRHVVRSLSPAPGSRVAATPPAPEGTADIRMRARAALMDARAHMPSLLDEPLPTPPIVEHHTTETIDLRQALRGYTDRVDRLLADADEERRMLRKQVGRLTGEMLALRAEMAEMRATLMDSSATDRRAPIALPVGTPRPELTAGMPPPPATARPSGQAAARLDVVGASAAPDTTAIPAPPAPAASGGTSPTLDPVAMFGNTPTFISARDHELEATRDTRDRGGDSGASRPSAPPPAGAPHDEDTRRESRIFPAGTVGILLTFRPAQRPERVAAIAGRIVTDPGLEHAEVVEGGVGASGMRLTFRQPMPWPRLRTIIEAATGAMIDPDSVVIGQGAVAVRLRGRVGESPERPP